MRPLIAILLRGHHALDLGAGALHQLAYFLGALAKASEHVRGDDLGVGGVGAPDPDAHAPEVRAAELALERLQAVVAGQAAAETRAQLAEGQVDLVVHDEHALEWQAVGAARGSDGAAGLVHVGLRQQHRDAHWIGSPPARAALGEQRAEARAHAWQPPALAERFGDHEADVVRRARVLAAGIAESYDQPVDLRPKHHLIVREPRR